VQLLARIDELEERLRRSESLREVR
jgi:hypothetical protein